MGSTRRAAVAVLVGTVLTIGACGGTSDTATGSLVAADVGADVGVSGLPMCDDLQPYRAPDATYRDAPVYVGNEQPTGRVQAWAQGQPGFVDLWIDRERNGWVTVAFVGDPQERQAEIDSLFPGDGIVAVRADRTGEELQAVADEIIAATADSGVVGTWVAPHLGVVGVDIGFLNDDRLALLEPYAADPVCVRGAPASDYVEAGPQLTAGEGWRLLGEDLTGEVYRTGVATDAAQYAQLWARAGLTGEAPEVDFRTEIVIWFGAVYGSSCPVRLDDVVVAGEVVHADIVVPDGPGYCTDDARSHAYVVAVDRSVLPVGPFFVQLGEKVPRGVPLSRTVVAVDLSTPGSTAEASETGPDEGLVDAADQPFAVSSGGWVEVGQPFLYALVVETGCGVARLGELNGVRWIAEDARDVPSAWQALVADGQLTVEVVIMDSPAALTATAGGTSVAYRPVRTGDTDTCR